MAVTGQVTWSRCLSTPTVNQEVGGSNPTGGLPFGLVVGRRTFTVTPAGSSAEFRMHLHMSGPLASLILKGVGNRQLEIDRFSAALKQRAESR